MSLINDPIAYAIGACAATAIHFYQRTTTRGRSLANFLICIMLAGIVAPRAAIIAGVHIGSTWDDPHLWAVLLAAGWPLALSAAPKFVDAWAARISGGAALAAAPGHYTDPGPGQDAGPGANLAQGLAPGTAAATGAATGPAGPDPLAPSATPAPPAPPVLSYSTRIPAPPVYPASPARPSTPTE